MDCSDMWLSLLQGIVLRTIITINDTLYLHLLSAAAGTLEEAKVLVKLFFSMEKLMPVPLFMAA